MSTAAKAWQRRFGKERMAKAKRRRDWKCNGYALNSSARGLAKAMKGKRAPAMTGAIFCAIFQIELPWKSGIITVSETEITHKKH